jgi:hypothetical protein
MLVTVLKEITQIILPFVSPKCIAWVTGITHDNVEAIVLAGDNEHLGWTLIHADDAMRGAIADKLAKTGTIVPIRLEWVPWPEGRTGIKPIITGLAYEDMSNDGKEKEKAVSESPKVEEVQ